MKCLRCGIDNNEGEMNCTNCGSVLEGQAKKALIFKYISMGIVLFITLLVLISTFTPILSVTTSGATDDIGVNSVSLINMFKEINSVKGLTGEALSHYNTATNLPAIFTILFIIANLIITIVLAYFMGMKVYKYFTGKSDDLDLNKYFGYLVASFLTMLLCVSMNNAYQSVEVTGSEIVYSTYILSVLPIIIIILMVGYVIYDLVLNMFKKTSRFQRIQKCLKSGSIIVVILLLLSMMNIGLAAFNSVTVSEVTTTMVLRYNPFAFFSQAHSVIGNKYSLFAGYQLVDADNAALSAATMLIIIDFLLIAAFAVYVVFSFQNTVKANIIKIGSSAVIILVSMFFAIYADLRDISILGNLDPYGSNGTYLTAVFGIAGLIVSFIQFNYSRRDERFEK